MEGVPHRIMIIQQDRSVIYTVTESMCVYLFLYLDACILLSHQHKPGNKSYCLINETSNSQRVNNIAELLYGIDNSTSRYLTDC